jgi:predicted ATP-dependent endonuclease of OLD family
MSNSESKKLYLKEVHLSGYKSIKDVEIDFQPGLNIIIGKNAAGKTNFLKFLNKVMNFDFQDLNNFKSNLILLNTNKITISSNRNVSVEELLYYKDSSNIDSKLIIEDAINGGNRTERVASNQEISKNKIDYDCTLLNHGIPTSYPIVNSSFSFDLEINGISDNLIKIIEDDKSPYFVRGLAIDLMFRNFDFNNLNDETIKSTLSNYFFDKMPINELLSKYSPIEEVRFNNNVNIYFNVELNILKLSNLILEFKIDGNWLPFEFLSDGSKRLFYIISEVFDLTNSYALRPVSYGLIMNSKLISRIILIEEPELGIHPHQYHQLLEFLKIQSENSQIIISTHSPQSLDILDEEEFNRIIIAYSNNGKEGTKMRHLNDAELLKAKQYIKDDYLSDYWLYSDLEQ